MMQRALASSRPTLNCTDAPASEYFTALLSRLVKMWPSSRSSASASGNAEATESSMEHRRCVADRISSTTRRQKVSKSNGDGRNSRLPESSRLRTRISYLYDDEHRLWQYGWINIAL